MLRNWSEDSESAFLFFLISEAIEAAIILRLELDLDLGTCGLEMLGGSGLPED